MHQDAFIEFAVRYLLIPGQLTSATESIKALGIDIPLPKLIESLLHLTDALGHRGLVLTESDALLVQWNPFSGMTPIITTHAMGSAGFDDHRWLQGMHASSVKVLYDQIHESVHAIWAAFGLCGGLSIIPRQQRGKFHNLAEANAVYIGDIEAHEALLDAGFFKSFWPSGAMRSHAVAFSALKGLKAVGLEGDKRADWLLKVYLDGESSLPSLPDTRSLRAEMLSFLIEETSYAEKIDLITTPNWMRYYWGRPEIDDFVKDFVPPTTFKLPDGSSLNTLTSLRSHWRSILQGTGWFHEDDVHFIRARLHIQRSALKVCELLSVFYSYRLQLAPEAITNAQRITQETRDQLLSLFLNDVRELTPSSHGAFTEERSIEVIDEVDQILANLQAKLLEVCGSCLILSHPYIDGLPFGESISSLKNPDQFPRDVGELIQCFTTICEEHKSMINQLKGQPTFTDELHRCHEGYLAAHQWLGRLNIDDQTDTLLEAQAFLDQLLKSRALWLVYPLSWMTVAPFIDPLIGFRYR